MMAAGMAMSGATPIDRTISSSVTGSRMSTSWSTGRPLRIEAPQSPCTSLPSQMTYWTRTGWAGPRAAPALARALLGVGVAEQGHDRVPGDRPHHHEPHEGDHEDGRYDLEDPPQDVD